VSRDKFSGFGGDDSLSGGANIDTLQGGAGNDTLDGGAARDTLQGGLDDDTMAGGADIDFFLFVEAAFGQDTVADFQDGLDKLKFDSSVADALGDFSIAGNTTATVVLTLIADPAQTITLEGAAPINIQASDFIFI
jgi:Ca2+-binding RTX toxin-like protein